MSNPLSWTTEPRTPASLKRLVYNPRHLSDDQKEQLRRSLKKFGYVEIAAVNSDGTIIAGHQRIGLLIEAGLGDKPVDVRIPSRKLTAQEVREYNIRSNKNSGEFDEALLTAHFTPEELGAWGFTGNELDGLFENVSPADVKEEELKPYTKTHVLLSFDPKLWTKIEQHLAMIQQIEGVEYETSSNG